MLEESCEEDDVKRLRRVREEMHARFKTWKAFWAHVDTFAKKRERRHTVSGGPPVRMGRGRAPAHGRSAWSCGANARHKIDDVVERCRKTREEVARRFGSLDSYLDHFEKLEGGGGKGRG